MKFNNQISYLLSIFLFCSSALSFTTSNNGGSFVASKRSMNTLSMTLLNYNGKKVEVKEGSPLSAACRKAGMKVKYSCKK